MKWAYRVCILLSFTIILLMASGCNNDKESTSQDGHIGTKTSVFSSESVEYDTEEDTVSKEYYLLKTVTNTDNIQTEYPQIQNLNCDVQGIWNKIMSDDISEKIRNTSQEDKLTITYDIMTEDSGLISILFRAESEIDGASYPYSYAYTYNIDIASGKNIRLADNNDIEQIAYSLFNGINYEIVSSDVTNEDLMSYMKSFYENSAELKETLAEFDYLDGTNYPTGYSYYKDGQLFLCIEVNHALGDYVIVKMISE